MVPYGTCWSKISTGWWSAMSTRLNRAHCALQAIEHFANESLPWEGYTQYTNVDWCSVILLSRSSHEPALVMYSKDGRSMLCGRTSLRYFFDATSWSRTSSMHNTCKQSGLLSWPNQSSTSLSRLSTAVYLKPSIAMQATLTHTFQRGRSYWTKMTLLVIL